jgi:hypothetical protein
LLAYQITVRARASRPAAFARGSGGILQRKCACGQHTSGGQGCEECKKKENSTLQRQSLGGPAPATAPPSVHEVMHSPGQPLDTTTRSFFEPRFGYDFSRVRIHTDGQASQSTREVKALAYTFRHDIAFRAGHYSPSSESGKQLIGHELEHVVRQTSNKIPTQPAQLGLQPENKPLFPIPVLDQFDPCLIVPKGLPAPFSAIGGQKVCGETAKKVWDFLHPKGKKHEVDCSLFLGFEPATSGEFKGQCCYGMLRSKENCCPPERIALLDGKCCQDDEIIQNDHCVKSAKVEPFPPPAKCLPGEVRNLFGECCKPGQPSDRFGNPCPISKGGGAGSDVFPPLDSSGLHRPKPGFKFGTIESMTIDHFDVDKQEIPEGNNPQLDHLAGLLQVYTEAEVHVEGHTDSTFTREYNKGLSDRRAAAVKKELVDRGVRADRIVTKGLGEDHLLFPKEKDAEEKARNRRVEIWFYVAPGKGAGATP